MRNVVKDLFNNDERISFPSGILLKGSSEDAKYYIEKHFGRCDCQLCTIECCKQRKKEQLDKLGSGVFEFRQYRLLLGSTDNIVGGINNSKLENIK
ncbi:hypothetical protein F8M41_014151 [Gigaspora margarita]|uniref:Uncharacterized protein n=1 Tax=Gigaspora margarita TaxID=4874 RepID=A0A8H3WXS8_GIGMA|nr:hypothetical protein F8M41_014151 [Gigaspora margarita]